jgi:hypothetical protein
MVILSVIYEKSEIDLLSVRALPVSANHAETVPCASFSCSFARTS